MSTVTTTGTPGTKPCIRCDKKLDPVFAGGLNQPSGGTAFTTHGHYGSTVFDATDSTYLELNICDECLREVAARGYVILATPVRPRQEPTLHTIFTPYVKPVAS